MFWVVLVTRFSTSKSPNTTVAPVVLVAIGAGVVGAGVVGAGVVGAGVVGAGVAGGLVGTTVAGTAVAGTAVAATAVGAATGAVTGEVVASGSWPVELAVSG